MKILNYFVTLLTLALAAPAGADEITCGSLVGGEKQFGPFDYRFYQGFERRIVERRHFTPNIEALGKIENGSLEGNIDYTLRAFPNHHRALAAMSNLSIQRKTRKFKDATYSIECYFDRGRRFAPDDGKVPMLYGMFLARTGEKDKARAELEAALVLEPDSANVRYNLGLIFLDMKDTDKALENGKRAYELGFPLPGLYGKLLKAGLWKDPPPASIPAKKLPKRESAKVGKLKTKSAAVEKDASNE